MLWCPDLSLLPETRSTRGESISKSQLTGRGSPAVLCCGRKPTSGDEPRDGSRSPNQMTPVALWFPPQGNLSLQSGWALRGTFLTLPLFWVGCGLWRHCGHLEIRLKSFNCLPQFLSRFIGVSGRLSRPIGTREEFWKS